MEFVLIFPREKNSTLEADAAAGQAGYASMKLKTLV
jgi:hypothetical protein